MEVIFCQGEANLTPPTGGSGTESAEQPPVLRLSLERLAAENATEMLLFWREAVRSSADGLKFTAADRSLWNRAMLADADGPMVTYWAFPLLLKLWYEQYGEFEAELTGYDYLILKGLSRGYGGRASALVASIVSALGEAKGVRSLRLYYYVPFPIPHLYEQPPEGVCLVPDAKRQQAARDAVELFLRLGGKRRLQALLAFDETMSRPNVGKDEAESVRYPVGSLPVEAITGDEHWQAIAYYTGIEGMLPGVASELFAEQGVLAEAGSPGQWSAFNRTVGRWEPASPREIEDIIRLVAFCRGDSFERLTDGKLREGVRRGEWLLSPGNGLAKASAENSPRLRLSMKKRRGPKTLPPESDGKP